MATVTEVRDACPTLGYCDVPAGLVLDQAQFYADTTWCVQLRATTLRLPWTEALSLELTWMRRHLARYYPPDVLQVLCDWVQDLDIE